MGTGNRSDLKILAIVLIASAALIAGAFALGIPLFNELVSALEPGVGLKTAALWSFGVTIVLFVLFALVAGDGLLGELQFMLGGFFLFFVIITLLIAWVF